MFGLKNKLDEIISEYIGEPDNPIILDKLKDKLIRTMIDSGAIEPDEVLDFDLTTDCGVINFQPNNEFTRELLENIFDEEPPINLEDYE